MGEKGTHFSVSNVLDIGPTTDLCQCVHALCPASARSLHALSNLCLWSFNGDAPPAFENIFPILTGRLPPS